MLLVVVNVLAVATVDFTFFFFILLKSQCCVACQMSDSQPKPPGFHMAPSGSIQKERCQPKSVEVKIVIFGMIFECSSANAINEHLETI